MSAASPTKIFGPHLNFVHLIVAGLPTFVLLWTLAARWQHVEDGLAKEIFDRQSEDTRIIAKLEGDHALSAAKSEEFQHRVLDRLEVITNRPFFPPDIINPPQPVQQAALNLPAPAGPVPVPVPAGPVRLRIPPSVQRVEVPPAPPPLPPSSRKDALPHG